LTSVSPLKVDAAIARDESLMDEIHGVRVRVRTENANGSKCALKIYSVCVNCGKFCAQK
jgi:hypothetical protein